MKLYFLQLIRHSKYWARNGLFTSYEWCWSWSDESVAVPLQVVNAARLVAALLHDASLDLGLIMARQSLPEPPPLLLLSGSFGQEPFEVEKSFHSLKLSSTAGVQTTNSSNYHSDWWHFNGDLMVR